MNTLVTYNPVTVAPGDSLSLVVRLMDEYVLRHLPVVDDGFRLLGIISDSDVARSIEQCLGDPTRSARFADRWPTAADVMTREVTSVRGSDSPASMLEALLFRRFHSVPVIEQGRLRGIVTSTDFLRELANLAPAAARGPMQPAVTPWPPTMDRSASVDEAHGLMMRRGCEVLGVDSEGRTVAAVSMRMLHRARHWDLVAGESNDGSLLVDTAPTLAEVIDDVPGTIYATATLGAAAATLAERRRDVLAVIDATGKPLGVVTETDVLRSLACALAGT